MVTLTLSYPSQALGRPVNVRAVVPADGSDTPGTPWPALYLLHGLGGAEDCVFDFTRLAFWARQHGLAVFCPAGENSFYVTRHDTGEDYFRMIGEELPRMMRQLFPLSCRREDSFIGGISMGGFGALNAGYAYPQTFGKVMALSSALRPWTRASLMTDKRADALFGPDKTRWDTLALARACVGPVPQVWMACGAQDELLEENRDFAASAAALGLPVRLVVRPGGHTWDYWNEALEEGLRFLMT